MISKQKLTWYIIIVIEKKLCNYLFNPINQISTLNPIIHIQTINPKYISIH